MKMTTEQFLSHLGIEVGQEFNVFGWHDDMKWRVVLEDLTYYLEYKYSSIKDWVRSSHHINELLGMEITPLPKYTLTEDEKGIIRSLEERFRYMYRYYSGLLVVSSEKHSSDITHYFGELDMFKEMFKFIGKEEEVSLDELRKCL